MIFGRGVTPKVVSSRQLKLLESFDSNGDVTKLLRNNGYVKYDKKINVENLHHNVWYKNCGKAQVNKLFRASMIEKDLK